MHTCLFVIRNVQHTTFVWILVCIPFSQKNNNKWLRIHISNCTTPFSNRWHTCFPSFMQKTRKKKKERKVNTGKQKASHREEKSLNCLSTTTTTCSKIASLQRYSMINNLTALPRNNAWLWPLLPDISDPDSFATNKGELLASYSS